MAIRATGLSRYLRVVAFTGLMTGLALPAYAQAIDTLDPAADGYVRAVALQKDGKILVGGDFFHFGCRPNCGPGSVERNYIARLNADGTLDMAFNPGADGPVWAIVVQPDDRIVIAGAFLMVGGGGTGNQNFKYLARLNPDGSVDPTFNPGVNMNNPVYGMALQPDGKIVVGGGFYGGLGGQTRYYFGRLNADGTADETFETWTNGTVQCVALQADGKILIGGLFTSIGGESPDTTRNFIGRVNADGTVDMTFNPGADQRVDTIAVQSNGQILVGGFFTGLGSGDGSTPRFHIGRLEPDGIVDQNFIPGADSLVLSIAVQADGRIIVGGSFITLGGGGTGVSTRNGIGRLNPDGSLDPTFDPGANGSVRGMVLQTDGRLIVGGTFTHVGDGTGTTDRRYIARIINSDPPVQSVTVDGGGTSVTWLRNGTLPDVTFVDFAMSTDGVNYTFLGGGTGAGTRIVGGWRITGVALPVHPNLTLRMRAHYTGGQENASGSMIEWIVPASDFNTIENGDFTFGLSGWLFFATPDMTYIDRNVTNEVLNFFRVPPPPGTTNQAVAYQQTGVSLSANVPLIAEFDLGNSSTVRKRIAVLLHDSDFSDIAVCTFWLPANSPLTRYRILTHTTKTWLNLTISFYAASAGSNGGAYQIDNVAVRYLPGGSTTETLCDDALTPGPGGGGDSATLLVNGDFSSGTVAPGWSLFGQISGAVTGGVFQFTKVAGNPAGVILQQTGLTAAANEILTATFQLGNNSPDRRRVTVILHDNNFSDLSACTFWLAPNQALSDYTYRTFAAQAWGNVTLSVYPATVGTVGVHPLLLDNVTLRRTPSAVIGGTECLEPGSGVVNLSAKYGKPASGTLLQLAAQRSTAPSAEPAAAESAPATAALASVVRGHWVDEGLAIDLTSSAGATLQIESWLTATGSRAVVQVTTDGVSWDTVHIVGESEAWTPVVVDLNPYLGSAIRVRFRLEAAGPAHGEVRDVWRIRSIRLREPAPCYHGPPCRQGG